MRIRRISSRPEESATAVVTEYRYDDARFEIYLGSDDFVDDLHTLGFRNGVTGYEPSLIYDCARTVRFSTSPINETVLDYKARYGKVSKLRYDSKSGKYGGKTVSVYGHIPVDEASSFSSDAHITPFYDDGSINLQVPASSTWNRRVLD